MTRRPQTHLAEIVRFNDSGDATAELREVLRAGLFALNEQKKAARIAERGTADKLNPHVSDAGRCPRQTVYSLMNVPESDPLTEDSLMNFLVGHAVEEAWAQILTAAGAEYVREERVSIRAGETVITGRKDFDGIRLLWLGSIVELKSINSRSMGWMLKRGEKGKPDHRRQLGLYLHAGGHDAGYLVYLIKDATRGEPILYAWRVDRNDDLAQDDVTSLALCHADAKRGFLPAIPEDYKKTAYPCTYCNYRGHCWTPDATLEVMLGKSLESKP